MDAGGKNLSFPDQLIQKLYKPEFADVEFDIGDDEKIQANKLVLAMVSPLFAEDFYGNNTADIKEFNYGVQQKAVLKIVLEYIYRGLLNSSELTADEKIDVYNVATELQFTELAKIMEHELNNIELELGNVAKLYEVASRNDLTWLVEKCLLFIDHKSEELVAAKDVFAKFPAILVLEAVKRDTFYAEELAIFDAIHYWIQCNPNEDAREILTYLRLKLIPAVDFGSSILPTQLITSEDYFRQITQKDDVSRRRVELDIESIGARSTEVGTSINCCGEQKSIAASALSSLLFNPRLSDVSFVFDDGEVIPAHRVVLAAACPKYAELFKEDMENAQPETKVIQETPKLFRLLLDFIHGKTVSLELLTDNEIIDLFELTQNAQLPPMIEMVVERMEHMEISMENVASLYSVASQNGLTTITEQCVIFVENNAYELIAKKELFAKLPKDLVEKIVSKKMNRNVFEALKEWKSQNDSDLSDILSDLPLHLISAREFAAEIRPTDLISDEKYFEAQLNQQPNNAVICNVACKFHSDGICNPQPQRIFSRNSRGIVCEEIRTFKTERQPHKFNANGENLVVELITPPNGCVINTIRFQLSDEFLRLYAYEVKVGLSKEHLDTVKPHFPGRVYASKQEIVFQPKPVKFLQITSFENNPLELYLWTIEALFDTGLGCEPYSRGNLIANLPVDETAKVLYPEFNGGSDEVVYILRSPTKVSTIGIQLNGHCGSKLNVFTKVHVNEQWNPQAEVDNLDSNIVVIFKESMVSFIKLTGPQIRHKIRYIECPAMPTNFRV